MYLSHNLFENPYGYRDTVPALETVTLIQKFGDVFFSSLYLPAFCFWVEGVEFCRLLPQHQAYLDLAGFACV